MQNRVDEVHDLASGLEEVLRWLRRSLPMPLSYSSYTALSRLHHDGPLRVSDLAAGEGMTQPGSTMLVNRLADGGYAERVPDPTDRRATLVRITDAGRQLLAERAEARASVLASRMAELPDEDRALLVAALPALHRLAGSGTAADSVTEVRGR